MSAGKRCALHPTPGYHHITVVAAGRTAYLAGR